MTDAAIHYGGALYELALEEGLTRQILDEVSVLSESFLEEPRFIQLLTTASIPRQERIMVLDICFRGKVHPYVLNFLKILTQRGCIREFSACAQAYRLRCNRDNGILPVTAVTAVDMSPELQEKLRSKLTSLTGKTVELSCKVDPEALGGVLLDFDGKQVDGTLRRRMDDIRSILKNTAL